MTVDIIICTYNRPESLLNLVKRLNQCYPLPQHILVVDSSEEVNKTIPQQPLVKYVYANHKNQPYQRYVGYLESSADVLIYLDDDMEVIEAGFINRVLQHFKINMQSTGLALCFKDKQTQSSLASIPVSKTFNRHGKVKQLVSWLTGYPTLPEGKLGPCGIRGPQPAKGGQTQWLSGGAFAAKREFLFKNLNFQLFDLFEEKLGMGEDALIGYALHTQGELYYQPDLLFYHNDQNNSHYALNHKAYAKRVLFSRLYLSLEKARMDQTSMLWARMHYIWYGGWRLLGYLVQMIKSGGQNRKDIFKGSWEGFQKALWFKYKPIEISQQFWNTEAALVVKQNS